MNPLAEYMLSPRSVREPRFDRPVAILKRCLRRIAVVLVSPDCFWKPLAKTLIRGSQYLCAVRETVEVEKIVEEYAELRDALSLRVVVGGPFEGLHYGETKACCSMLFPKLLGTYEHEIERIIYSSLADRHELVVDVGAADGYYAVGFAVKSEGSKVIAFEQDVRARRELGKLAELNGVSERIQIRGKCGSPELLKLPPKRGLLIVDCEGFEEDLLSPEVIEHLKTWNFIVETHDGYSADITKRLADRFSGTHTTVCVEAIHDFNKADHIDHPLLKSLPRRKADKLLSETRMHACLRWIVCTPRHLETEAAS